MPQTVEAIDHARAAGVPILVAVNKIDKEGADPNRVRTELAQHDLNPEEWGGDTVYADVSAKTKDGLDNLLEMITLVTDLEELGANPNVPASGTVVEAELDPGRGPVTGVLRSARHPSCRRRGRRRPGVGQGPGDARRQGRAGRGGHSRNSRRGPRLRRSQRSRRARPGGRERAQGPPARAGARDSAQDRAARPPPGPQGHPRGGLPERQRGPAQGAQHRAQGRRLRLAGGARGRDRASCRRSRSPSTSSTPRPAESTSPT